MITKFYDHNDKLYAFPVLPYVTQFTYDYLDFPPHVWGPSMTDPSQDMTVDELMSRYMRNIAVPRIPVENIDIDVSDYDTMDALERAKVARDLRVRNRSQRLDLQEEGRKIREREEKERFESELNSRIDVLEQARKDKADGKLS